MADGWTETRSPEQIASDMWAAITPIQIANSAAARVYDTPDVVQLAHSRNGRIHTVMTFTHGKNGWQNDYIDQCSIFGGA